MKKSRLFFLFSLMQAGFWCMTGSVYTMTTAYYNALGHSAKLIGVFLFAYTIAAFVGAFLLGPLSDKLNSQKKVFLFSVLGILLVSMSIYFTGPYRWGGVTYAVIGLLVSPAASVMDTWILKSFPENPALYGPIRGIGSGGYAVFMLFYGSLLEKYGYGLMIPFVILFAAITLVPIFILSDATRIQINLERPKMSLKPLLKNSGFIAILLFLFFIGMTHCPMYQYTPMIFEAVGGTVKHQSLALSLNAFLQAPAMMLSAKMNRFSTKQLLLGTLGIYVVSMLMMTLSGSIVLSVAGFTLLGAGYGVLLPAMRRALSESSPEELRTTAQSVGDSVFGSVAGMMTSLIGGVIIETWGVSLLLIGCTALLAPATVIALLVKTRKAH